MNTDSQAITVSDGRRTIGSRELIALLAMLMSGVALAIDIVGYRKLGIGRFHTLKL